MKKGKRLVTYRNFPREERKTATFGLISQESIRCQHLKKIQEAIQSSPNFFAAILDGELKTSRGRGKAQILAAIEGVRGIVVLSEWDLADLLLKHPDQILKIGNFNPHPNHSSKPINIEGTNLIRGVDLKEELTVEETEDPRDRKYIGEAFIVRKQSNCWWRPTGCVIVRDTKAIARGASLNLRGTECKSLKLRPDQINLEPGARISFCDAIHAEPAVIGWAAKNGVSLNESSLYITTAVCDRCAPLVASAGIKRVIFDAEYYDYDGIKLLKQLGVAVARIKYG